MFLAVSSLPGLEESLKTRHCGSPPQSLQGLRPVCHQRPQRCHALQPLLYPTRAAVSSSMALWDRREPLLPRGFPTHPEIALTDGRTLSAPPPPQAPAATSASRNRPVAPSCPCGERVGPTPPRELVGSWGWPDLCVPPRSADPPGSLRSHYLFI